MRRAAVLGTGGYVPEQVVRNDDLRDVYGIDTTDAWIAQRTGIAERRFAPAGTATSDLALHAARAALEAANLAATDLDLLVFCTLSPDRCFPGSGVLLHAKLGLGDAGRFIPAIDIRNQCSGFVYGLSHAHAMIAAGMAERVLVVGAEVQSAALDLTTRGRAVASLFGDGAGAVVLGASTDRGVRAVRLGADGRFADALTQRVWDMAERPYIPVGPDGDGRVAPDLLYPQMNGPLVFKHAVHRMTDAVRELLDAERLTVEDVDLFLFHQANARITAMVEEGCGIPPERTLHQIARYGNTTAATLPLLLDEAVRTGRVGPGSRVMLVAFGSGFSWGAALVDL
jgi:3-oxoacyl-[acyl-carrier-protein] synthase-3